MLLLLLVARFVIEELSSGDEVETDVCVNKEVKASKPIGELGRQPLGLVSARERTPPLSPLSIARDFLTPPGSLPTGEVLQQEKFISTDDMIVDDVVLSFVRPESDPVTPAFTDVGKAPQVSKVCTADRLLLPSYESNLDCKNSPFSRRVFSEELLACPDVYVRPTVDASGADQIYAPAWNVKTNADLNDSAVCRDVIDHIAPPLTAACLQEKTSQSIVSELSQTLAQAAALAAEGIHRWAHKEDVNRILGRNAKVLTKRLEVRESELDRLSDKYKQLIVQKKRAFNKYKYLLHDNTAFRTSAERLAVENERLKSELEKILSQPTVNQTSSAEGNVKGLVSPADVAERELISPEDTLLLEKNPWMQERSALLEELGSLRSDLERLSSNNAWLVKEGLKEFVSNLFGSSEYQTDRIHLCNLARLAGFSEGAKEGHKSAKLKIPLSAIMSYDAQASDVFGEALAVPLSVDFPYLDDLAAHAGQPVKVLRGILPKPPFGE